MNGQNYGKIVVLLLALALVSLAYTLSPSAQSAPVAPIPQSVSISPTSQSVSVTNTITINALASGGSGSYSYQWFNITSGNPVATTQSTNSFSIVATATGTFSYNVVVTDPTNSSNITSSSPASVTVSAPVVPSPTVSASTSNANVISGNGNTITITATPQDLGSGGDTYEWFNTTSGSAVDTGKSGLTFRETANIAGTFTYNVVVTDSSGATGTSNQISVVVSAPVVSSSGPTVSISQLTQGVDIADTITIVAVPGSVGSGKDTYEWFNTTSGSVVDTGKSGLIFTEVAAPKIGTFTYNVVVTDSAHKSATSQTATITVSTGPTVSISPPNQAVHGGDTIQINATPGSLGSGADKYEWYNTTDGTFVDTHHNGLVFVEVANATSGVVSYNVIVTDSDNQSGTSNPSYVTVLVGSSSSSQSSTSISSTTTISPTINSTSVPTSTIKPVPKPNPQVLLNSSYKVTPPSQLVLYLTKANTTLYVSAISPGVANVTAVNITNSIIAFPGYTPIVVLNLSVTMQAKFTSAVQMQYPCTIAASTLEPYLLDKSGWHAFNNYTIDPQACTIRFGIPSDPVIALFQYNQPGNTLPTATKAPPASSNITSNSITTTTPANIIVKDPKPSYPIPFLPLTSEEIAATVVIIVFIALLFYMAKPSD